MAAPIRFLSGRQQQQKIGVIGSTENEKVLEVVGRVGIGTTIFDPSATLDVRGSVNIRDNLYVTGFTTFVNNVEFFGPSSAELTWDSVESILRFKDDVAAYFGDGDDLRIFHNGSDSYISDGGVGNLNIISNGLGVSIKKSGTESIANFNTDGSVELYYDNSKKFETTGYGVTVSGGVYVSGISTFTSSVDINTDLDVDGFTELDATNISETLNVSGVSTFASNVDIGGNVDIDGHTELDNLNVSGIATLGVTTLTDLTAQQLNVSGIATFASNVDINAGLDVDGHTELDNLNVSGVSTFASNVDINAGLDVDGRTELDTTNISETLNVIGISTFASNVDINADLDVDGFTELDATNISETLNVIGISTFASNVDINADIDVDGRVELDTTNISETLNVVGVSTFGSNVDINADLDVDGHTELDDLNVSGVSTFASNVDIGGNVDVDGHTELDNLNVSGITTLGVTTLTDLTAQQLNVSGITTLGVTTLTDVTAQQLNVSGVSTFQDNVFLGDNDVLNFGDGNDLQIYHTGSVSYISDQGSGALRLLSDKFRVKNAADTKEMATFTQGGSVDLYYNNSKKFETTGAGVSVSNGTASTATIYGPSNLIIDPMPIGVGTTSGIVRIKGDLYVDGTTTQINSTVIELADFIVGIATTATSDLLADGAGIQIGPDNTFLYEYNGGTDPSLKSSENLNVASGKHYQIGETEVLNATTLGSGVTISSLTQVGTINTGVWEGTQINDDYLGTIDNDNKVSLSALNIDGGTDIGENLADGDLFIVDNGANGTNRRADVLGITTYTFGKVSGDITISASGVATIQSDSVALGDDTTGNYVEDVTAGSGLTKTSSAGEGQTVDLDIGAGTGITVNADDVAIKNADNLTGNKVIKWDDGNGQLTDSVITDDGTNIGIGTTNPTQKLDVDGNVRIREALYDYNDNAGDSTKILGSVGTGITWKTLGDIGGISGINITDDTSSTTAHYLVFIDQTSGQIVDQEVSSTQLVYKPEGKLGIGTTNPTVTLDVNGTLNVTDDSTLGVTTLTDLTAQQLNVSGVSTLGVTTLTDVTAQQLNITGISTFGGNVNLGTDDKIIFGDSGNLEIFSGGSNSIIDQVGSGDLILRTTSSGDDIILRATDDAFIQVAGSENAIVCNSNASVDLYYNNTKKFETTGYGVTVSGGAYISGIATASSFESTVSTGTAPFVVASTTKVTNLNADLLDGKSTANGASGNTVVIRNAAGGFDASDVNFANITASSGLNVSGIATITTIDATNATIDNLTFTSGTAITSVDTDLASVSSSDDTLASAKAIKTYVDAQITAQDLDFAGDTGTGAVDLDSQSLTIAGTANEIETSASGQTLTIGLPNDVTIGQDLTVNRDVQIVRNLNVDGNITVGGTSGTLFTETLKIADADLILGIRTDGSGNDVSTDNTANHGGIAIASTEGNPLITLTNPGAGETLPATYKKIMWFKSGSFTGLGTDAWLSNYAIGIGSTQFPTGTRLAAGSVQFTENDISVVRDINASGIVTADSYYFTSGNYFTSQPTGDFGSVQINGAGKGGWEGYSIDGHCVFMGESSTGAFGLYDDTNNHWALRHSRNSGDSITEIRGGNSSANLSVRGTDVRVENVPLIVNRTTLTGTASQNLQVDGGAYVSGDVGIGITNPNEELHVLGAAVISSDTATLGDDYSTLTIGERPAGDGYASLTFKNDTNALSAKIDGTSAGINIWSNKNSIDGDRFVWNGASTTEYLALRPRAQNVLRVQHDGTNGRIGINITAPAAALDIQTGYGTSYTGTFTAPDSYTPTTSEIRIGSDKGANAESGDYVGIRFSIIGNGSGNGNAGIFAVREQAEGNGKTSLAFATRNWGGNSNLTEKVRITADGNLGVGVTNPQANFVISSNGNNGIEIDPENSTGTNRILSYNRTSGQRTKLEFDVSELFVTNNQTEYLRLNSTGLGIGTNNPTEKLDVIGTVKATDFNTTSDQNLKTNIQTIENPLDKIVQIRGVNFEWKENNKPSAGVIAQEVEKVLPQLVNGEGTKTVNYNGLIGLLIEAVKAQQEEINMLKEKLK